MTIRASDAHSPRGACDGRVAGRALDACVGTRLGAYSTWGAYSNGVLGAATRMVVQAVGRMVYEHTRAP